MASLRALARLLLLALLLCSPALARDAPGPSAVVLIGEQSQEELTARLARAIEVQLLDLDVRFLVHRVAQLESTLPAQSELAARVAERERALLVLWCDLSTSDDVFLYLSEASGGRVLARRVTAAGSVPEGRFEAIALIVRTGAEAMSRGSRIGIGADAGVSPEPGSDEPWMLELGYALRGFAGEVSPNHAARLSLLAPLTGPWSLVTGYCVRPGIHLEDPEASLYLASHDLRLGLAREHRSGRYSLGGRVMAEGSLLRWQAEVHTAALRATPQRSAFTLGAVLESSIALSVQPWVRLGVHPGVVVLLLNQAYDLELAGQHRLLLSPWRLQPYLALDLSVHLR